MRTSILHPHFLAFAGVSLISLVLLGCSEKQKIHGHDAPEAMHPDDDHHETESPSSYQEGKGLSLLDETRKSLGLEMAEVVKRKVRPELIVTAQVYRSASESSRQYGKERQGNAYATAFITPETVKQLKSGELLNFASKGSAQEMHQGVVWKIDSSQVPILGKAEALLELPDADASLKVGDFIEAKIPLPPASEDVLGILSSAVLKTSTGTFAFVQNGNFLLRTEIKTGTSSGEHMEVTEGLYEGDVIVTKPVEALYLIELRATKGGGHSH